MMADVFQTFDKDGKPHKKWRFRYTDWTGARRKGTGYTSKNETQKLADRIQAQEHAIRKGYAPKPTLAMQPRRFSDAIKEYLAWGAVSGGKDDGPWSTEHADKRAEKLEWWRLELDLEDLSQLVGIQARVEQKLRALLQENIAKKGEEARFRTTQTVQRYADALKGLCLWACDRDYLDRDPLKKLKSLPRKTTYVRRAITPDEIRSLLENCWPSHRLLYQLAIATGLRANEIRSITVAHLDFNRGGLRLDECWTKNRKGGFQYLPDALMQQLKHEVKGRALSAALVHVGDHPARDLDADLKRAKPEIKKWAAGGKVDFHALRTAFSTLLDDSGATPAENMQMMRHATPLQTFGTYTKARNNRLAQLAEIVGSVILDGPKLAQRKAAGK